MEVESVTISEQKHKKRTIMMNSATKVPQGQTSAWEWAYLHNIIICVLLAQYQYLIFSFIKYYSYCQYQYTVTLLMLITECIRLDCTGAPYKVNSV